MQQNTTFLRENLRKTQENRKKFVKNIIYKKFGIKERYIDLI